MGNTVPKEDELESEQSFLGRLKRLFASPWRGIGPWNQKEKKKLLSSILNMNIEGDVKQINCLLIGQISSGKTSFCNAAATALADSGEIKSPFTVYQEGEGTTTKKLDICNLYARDKSMKLAVYDCRGIHDIDSIRLEDVLRIVDGHIKPGYILKSDEPISESDDKYRRNPTLNDKMHCVIYVMDATASRRLLATETTKAIFSEVRRILSGKHVPQLVLVNKVDRMHVNFKNNLEVVFYSDYLKSFLGNVASFTNLDERNILVQSNYCTEKNPDLKRDFLTLNNLREIMQRANDYFTYIVKTQNYDEERD
ncbi:interferon-induced protein 44-like [Saccostrea cucullata]|uniref:interferon-induced protein 44-like n=1 Tax=Saccostrea cuccullata TaxID=36930 RepID=UPI002ED3E010